MKLNVKLHEIPHICSSTIISSMFLRQTLSPTIIFQKRSNRVQDISEWVILSKTGRRKFSRIQYFLRIYIEESKKGTWKFVSRVFLSEEKFYWLIEISPLWLKQMIIYKFYRIWKHTSCNKIFSTQLFCSVSEMLNIF